MTPATRVDRSAREYSTPFKSVQTKHSPRAWARPSRKPSTLCGHARSTGAGPGRSVGVVAGVEDEDAFAAFGEDLPQVAHRRTDVQLIRGRGEQHDAAAINPVFGNTIG